MLEQEYIQERQPQIPVQNSSKNIKKKGNKIRGLQRDKNATVEIKIRTNIG